MDEGWTRFVLREGDAASPTRRCTIARSARAACATASTRSCFPTRRRQPCADGHAGRARCRPSTWAGSGLGWRGGAARLRRGRRDARRARTARRATRSPRSSCQCRTSLAGLDAAAFFCPGSILRVTVDDDSAARARPAVAAARLVRGLARLRGASAGRSSPATRRRARCCPAGWSAARLAGRAALVEVPLGRASVVLFGFRPQYRAQSRVTYPALLNALYLSAAEP